ncbi:MAG TPA: lysophospholipid acyltransferase family protein [Burkholderiales bacterium]|nr:lysophospholipid acyltransferase family protein [Burkholderiales bacterium]
MLSASGWNIEGEFPSRPKMVAIVAPHTSNWDFIVGILAVFAIGIDVRFLAKHTLFKGPLAGFMRWCGGMPVNREAPQGLVPQVADAIAAAPAVLLAITPAGTRSSTKPWKSGFYHIAVAARVPILPVIFDGPARTIRFLPAFEPSGDYSADLPRLQALYAGVRGIRP